MMQGNSAVIRSWITRTLVEPGFRWIKNPAAMSPGWLEKPERIAALAMLTVVGLLVYSIIQRQVRLYLRTHDQQLPGNKGETATPTAAVVLALFAQVALGQWWIGDQEVAQVYGLQPSHRLICDALGLDSSWYEVPSAHKNSRFCQTVSGCVKMLENRSFENAGCALGSRRCENAGLQRE
jgi:hypothetical protein